MASKRKIDKYSKLKPKVSPLTYIGVGVFFLMIILTIFLVVDSPSTKFLKSYKAGERLVQEPDFNLDLDKNHNFVKIKLSKLESVIQKEENVLVLFGSPNCQYCVITVDKLQKAYDQAGYYEGTNEVSSHVDKIYYVELDTNTNEEGQRVFDLKGLSDFFKEHSLTGYNNVPNIVAFKDGEVALQYKAIEDETLSAEARIIRSVRDFFNTITEEFSS